MKILAQMQEEVRQRFDEYFYDSDHSLTENQRAHIWKNLILPFTAEVDANAEARGFAAGLDAVEREFESVFCTDRLSKCDCTDDHETQERFYAAITALRSST